LYSLLTFELLENCDGYNKCYKLKKLILKSENLKPGALAQVCNPIYSGELVI
jgi:hypothetical protein